MCILQREETLHHLFIKCNFTKRCWESIGLNLPGHRNTFQLMQWLTMRLSVPFFMDIVILMSWCIRTTRNEWIFNNIDPHVESTRSKFFRELTMMLHRAKAKYVDGIQTLIQDSF